MENFSSQRRYFAAVISVFQVILIVLFGIFAEYERSAKPKASATDSHDADLHPAYAMFQDVHIMIFVGFGFLMTFLKKYGYSALGVNFLLAAFSLQWAILVQGLLHSKGGTFPVGIKALLEGDIAAAAVLITFGAVLGKLSPLQLMIVALIEIVFFSVNMYIGMAVLGAVDAGGSMFVHAFGAYFGLAVAWICNQKWHRDHSLASAVYHSDLFSLIGTIFLWICWPSFNAALVPDGQQYRAIVNTYLALAACVISSFAVSIFVSPKAKLNIVHVQNATLAGGVAMGTAADFVVNPFGAMTIGLVAGALSVIGYQFFTPRLERIGIHDTCGVNNLHGIPGVLAGIVGIIATAIATTSSYGADLYVIFPKITTIAVSTNTTMEAGRSIGEQAGMQAAALGITLLTAIVGGLITGLMLRFQFLLQVKEHTGFDDQLFFELPEDEESGKLENKKPETAGTMGKDVLTPATDSYTKLTAQSLKQ